MKPRVFPISKNHYALLAGACGCAVFTVNGGDAWICGLQGRMDDDVAATIVSGLSGGLPLPEALRVHDARQPVAHSFMELANLLMACGVVRDYQDLCRACGLGRQRIYQLFSDQTTMPSRESLQKLRETIEQAHSPYRTAFLELVDSLYSKANPSPRRFRSDAGS